MNNSNPLNAQELITGTKDENFNEACRSQRLADACGPHDPYYRIALANVDYFLECAALLERGERYITIKSKWINP